MLNSFLVDKQCKVVPQYSSRILSNVRLCSVMEVTDGHLQPQLLSMHGRKLQSQLFFDQLNACNETNMGLHWLSSLILSPVGRISQGYIVTVLHQAVLVEVQLSNKWLARMDLRVHFSAWVQVMWILDFQMIWCCSGSNKCRTESSQNVYQLLPTLLSLLICDLLQSFIFLLHYVWVK